MSVAGEVRPRPEIPARDGVVLRPTRLPLAWLGGAAVVLAAAVVAGVTVGPADIGAWQAVAALLDRLPLLDVDSGLAARETAILWSLRIPRVALGVIVGAMLSLAGAAYQGVFRNPLADPYLLGIAAGAGLGATVAIVVGGSGGFALPVAAFAGGLLGVALTYALGRSVGGRSTSSIILAGVAVAAFLTAIQTYVQQQHAETMREVYTWILGRLTTSGWSDVVIVLPYALVAGIVILLHRRLLDVLAVGSEEADTLGVNTGRVRLIVVLAATLGTAAAVAVSGLIGFVGIIVPHGVRLVAGTSHRILLPLSVLVGGAFLVVADLLARTLTSPAELPIGVVTAFFGAPFFTLVLRASRKRLA